jgi:hypothetical protein
VVEKELLIYSNVLNVKFLVVRQAMEAVRGSIKRMLHLKIKSF